MDADARLASPDDVPELVRLYRRLEEEMVDLKPVWRLAEGLPEPVDASFRGALADPSTRTYVGVFHGLPVGFLLGRTESLLPQAGTDRMAAIRFIFTEPEFREIGVGEALIGSFLTDCRAEGFRYFDAHVSPGHRLAKNFFEANGFKARHIVMHHDTEA